MEDQQASNDRAVKGRRWRSLIPGVLKTTLGLGLVSYLFWRAQQEQAFADLLNEEKNWAALGFAFVLTTVAALLSFVRWFMVTRAADLDITLPEAIRIGALGYALNFVGPGAIGGDLYKAVVVARGQPGRRATAVTTLLIDRLTGLLTMALVASVGIMLLDTERANLTADARYACNVTMFVAATGLLATGLMMLPGVAGTWLSNLVQRIPLVGSLLRELVDAWGIYQQRKRWLLAAAAVCLVVDFLLVASFYCVAIGLPFAAPSFLHHTIIVPIELTAAALIPTPAGVGAREAAVAFLYQGFGYDFAQGALIAFGHGLTMLAVGGLAVSYYLSRRASIRAALAGADGQATST